MGSYTKRLGGMWLLAGVLCLGWSPAVLGGAPRSRAAGGAMPAGMRSYPTQYYQMYTDLGPDEVKEAAIRMTRMAEEYHERTAGFSGTINRRLPFYLFSKADDYYAAGGVPGSAGVFMGDKLMAIAGEHVGTGTWHVIQHEGFHQFAAYVIRGHLPIWVNEGLAEYFGESIFTGDGFVTGVLPPARLERLKKEMQGGQLKSVRELMLLSHAAWNSGLSLGNYDQAWSLVYFLAHGDGGKYQTAFAGFMKDIGRNVPYAKAWLDHFGPADKLEERWKAYFQGLAENPTADVYARAHVATLTSFLARATAQKQRFDSFTAFHTAAAAGTLKVGGEDWLPPALLENTLKGLDGEAQWSLGKNPTRQPEVICLCPDGTQLTGRFTLVREKVRRVWVEEDDLGRTVKEAKQLIASGKKEEARDLLREGLRAHPRSASTEAARQLMAETK